MTEIKAIVGAHGETVGRAVHYVDAGAPIVRAATITEVNLATGTVHLAVTRPGVIEHRMGVPFSETYQHSHWSWPVRVAKPGAVGAGTPAGTAQVRAVDVKAVREATGASYADCKRALELTNDVVQAVADIRAKGQASA
jgi:NACalpha-BTF3-like transcription factor